MIIKTRYRDIPWEEARKCQPSAGCPGEFWETQMRRQPVSLVAPAFAPIRYRMICGGPFFRVEGDYLVVCPHIAEIGD